MVSRARRTTATLVLVGLLTIFIVPVPAAMGAGAIPRLLLTWETNSFTPPTYIGARLPSEGSTVTVLGQFTLDNKLTGADDLNIRWFINGQLYQEGLGITKITFNTSEVSSSGGGYVIDATIRGYQPTPITSSLFIPRGTPKLVITTPLPGRNVSLDGTLIAAAPYFFNIASLSELSFNWTIAGRPQPSSGNTLFLSLKEAFKSGQEVSVGVSANVGATPIAFGSLNATVY